MNKELSTSLSRTQMNKLRQLATQRNTSVSALLRSLIVSLIADTELPKSEQEKQSNDKSIRTTEEE